jgi:hypothetical protein
MKSNLTLVTCLFDIKRGDLPDDGFGRSFDHYKECFKRLLHTELPMVIFCDSDVEEMVWEIRSRDNTHLVHKSLDDIRNFPFYEQTNRLRQEEEWRQRAGWIPNSPQSQLELYNPLVMTKQFFLNDAAIFDPFNTKYFLWIDGGISNTIGDPCNYFTTDFSRRLTKQMNKMLYVCFPYDGNVEVHGFPKEDFDRIAGEPTTRVARGGMFGGSKYAISEINGIYYQLLHDTLNNGLMGTEESLFTLITYTHPQLVNILPIDGNGLIVTGLENIKNNVRNSDAPRLAVYTLAFNIPEQFKMWAESFRDVLPNEYESVAKYVINNSTDPDVNDEFQALFAEHGFTEFKHDNIGICGGRQFAAEHFAGSEHEYMLFFEDDMLFHPEGAKACKNGFTTYHGDLFDKCIDIMDNEELDYLKLTFSEFYGDNHENWAWYNVPMDKKPGYFPDKPDGSNPKSTVVFRTGSLRGLPYAVGEYHYCNWPLLFNKDGNKKVFIDVKYEHLYEQTWMSHVMNLMRDGNIKAGSLLASPINHNRAYHYDGKTRRENEHYDN